GARTDHHGKAIVLSAENALQGRATCRDGRRGFGCAGDFAHELFRGDALPDVADAQVVGANVHSGSSGWRLHWRKKSRQWIWRFFWYSSFCETSARVQPAYRQCLWPVIKEAGKAVAAGLGN